MESSSLSPREFISVGDNLREKGTVVKSAPVPMTLGQDSSDSVRGGINFQDKRQRGVRVVEEWSRGEKVMKGASGVHFAMLGALAVKEVMGAATELKWR